MELFFLLLFGHALADYPLQGDYLSQSKNPNNPLGANGIWIHSLIAHSIIHGGTVFLITGSFILGLAETVIHGFTDLAKVKGKISYHTDQFIHIATKLLWAMIILSVN
jgi:hypothetical protein